MTNAPATKRTQKAVPRSLLTNRLENVSKAVFKSHYELITELVGDSHGIYGAMQACCRMEIPSLCTRPGSYDLAQHGSFKLVPPAHRLAALANDYAVMRPMFMREPLPFEQVMRQLAVAEQTINGL